VNGGKNTAALTRARPPAEGYTIPGPILIYIHTRTDNDGQRDTAPGKLISSRALSLSRFVFFFLFIYIYSLTRTATKRTHARIAASVYAIHACMYRLGRGELCSGGGGTPIRHIWRRRHLEFTSDPGRFPEGGRLGKRSEMKTARPPSFPPPFRHVCKPRRVYASVPHRHVTRAIQ